MGTRLDRPSCTEHVAVCRPVMFVAYMGRIIILLLQMTSDGKVVLKNWPVQVQVPDIKIYDLVQILVYTF